MFKQKSLKLPTYFIKWSNIYYKKTPDWFNIIMDPLAIKKI